MSSVISTGLKGQQEQETNQYLSTFALNQEPGKEIHPDLRPEPGKETAEVMEIICKLYQQAYNFQSYQSTRFPRLKRQDTFEASEKTTQDIVWE